MFVLRKCHLRLPHRGTSINLTNLYCCVFYCQKALQGKFTFFFFLDELCASCTFVFQNLNLTPLKSFRSSTFQRRIPIKHNPLLPAGRKYSGKKYSWTGRRLNRGQNWTQGRQLGDFKKWCPSPPRCSGFITRAPTGAKYHHPAMKSLWHSNRVELAEIRRKYDEKKWRILPLNPLLLYSSQRFQPEMMHSSSVRKIFSLTS